jgi:hypothetical protein
MRMVCRVCKRYVSKQSLFIAYVGQGGVVHYACWLLPAGLRDNISRAFEQALEQPKSL